MIATACFKVILSLVIELLQAQARLLYENLLAVEAPTVQCRL